MGTITYATDINDSVDTGEKNHFLEEVKLSNTKLIFGYLAANADPKNSNTSLILALL